MEDKLEDLAKRLIEVRKEYATIVGENITKTELAKRTGISLNMIQRFEASGNGSISNLLQLINFYHQNGINIKYLLIDDNSKFSIRSEVERQVVNHLNIDSMVFDSMFLLQTLKDDLNAVIDKRKQKMIDDMSNDGA